MFNFMKKLCCCSSTSKKYKPGSIIPIDRSDEPLKKNQMNYYN